MDQINDIISTLPSFELSPYSFFKIMLIASLAFFILGIIFKAIRGKQSLLNQAVGSALAILTSYVICYIVLCVNPDYRTYLPAFPFIRYKENAIAVIPIIGATFTAISPEVIHLMILSFLMNLLDFLIPTGKKFISWFFSRCLCIAAVFVGYAMVCWAFSAFLRGFIMTYAPIILIIFAVILLAVTVFKLIIGVILGITLGPVIGAIYTFFFSNLVGKQLVKATLTSFLLLAFVAMLNYFGYTTILLISVPFYILLPAAFLFFVVWFFLFKFL